MADNIYTVLKSAYAWMISMVAGLAFLFFGLGAKVPFVDLNSYDVDRSFHVGCVLVLLGFALAIWRARSLNRNPK
jgi:uncharacterized membrane protein YqjE